MTVFPLALRPSSALATNSGGSAMHPSQTLIWSSPLSVAGSTVSLCQDCSNCSSHLYSNVIVQPLRLTFVYQGVFFPTEDILPSGTDLLSPAISPCSVISTPWVICPPSQTVLSCGMSCVQRLLLDVSIANAHAFWRCS